MKTIVEALQDLYVALGGEASDVAGGLSFSAAQQSDKPFIAGI